MGTGTDPGDPATVHLEIPVQGGVKVVGDKNNVDSGYPKKIQMGHLWQVQDWMGSQSGRKRIAPGRCSGSKTYPSRRGQQLWKPGGGREGDTNAAVYGNLLGSTERCWDLSGDKLQVIRVDRRPVRDSRRPRRDPHSP